MFRPPAARGEAVSAHLAGVACGQLLSMAVLLPAGRLECWSTRQGRARAGCCAILETMSTVNLALLAMVPRLANPAWLEILAQRLVLLLLLLHACM